MADHDVFIGGSTFLRIRDLGYNVEFWVKTGSSTWNSAQPWSYHANGGDSPLLHHRLIGGGNWQFMGGVSVPYDQTVRLSIYDSGLGFPTFNFFQHIQRSTVPGPPNIWETVALSSTSIRVQFADGYDGGSGIVERQVGLGGNPNSPEFYYDSNGNTTVSTFAPGSRVFFWARTRNAVGWSGWSNRTEATTWRVPDAPSPVQTGSQTQTSIWTKIIDAFNGGTDILERQLAYGTDPVTAQVTVSGTAIERTLTNLNPGRTYYFWSRVRNSVGWSSWSVRTTTNLIAGAKVKHDGVWKRAVPYVRHGGVWKVVRPWVRKAGEWEETSA